MKIIKSAAVIASERKILNTLNNLLSRGYVHRRISVYFFFLNCAVGAINTGRVIAFADERGPFGILAIALPILGAGFVARNIHQQTRQLFHVIACRKAAVALFAATDHGLTTAVEHYNDQFLAALQRI